MTRPLTTPALAAGNLEHRLQAAWQREVRFHVLRGLSAVGLCTVGLAGVDFLLDWGFDLPGMARTLLFLANLAVLGWAFWTVAWRQIRRPDPVLLALRLEKNHPELHSVLVSAVQLNEADIRDETSPALVRAVKRQAGELTGRIDFGELVKFRDFRPLLLAALVALAVLAVGAVARPQHAWVLMSRLVNPWSARAYPTRTTIIAGTGDMTVRQGDPVRLEVRAGGEIPAQGTLRVKFAGAGWESIELTGQGAGEFRHGFDQVTGDFSYRFKLGDALSPVYRVTTVAPPRMVEGSVKLEYPPYTRLAPEAQPTFNLKVPENTRVSWQLKLNKPITKAELVLENRNPVPMTLGAGGETTGLTMPAEASSSYRFRFTWQLDGRDYVDEGPKNFLQVIPDLDPRVDLVYPAEDEKATLDKVLTLKFLAQDDYGLEHATIVYAVNDGTEQKRPAETLGGQRAVEKELTWALKDSVSGLKEGDILTFLVQVADGRAGQPGSTGHVARTKSRRVQFVSNKEYLEYALSRQRKYLGQLRPLYLNEREAADHLRELGLTRTPSSGPASQPNGSAGSADQEATR